MSRSEEVEQLDALIRILVKRRHELHHSQETINYEVGVADRLLSKWEIGMKHPSLRSLMRWAEALDMTLDITVKEKK